MRDELPDPAPQVVMDRFGNYWRRWSDGTVGMPPVSTDNGSLLGPLALYAQVGFQHADGEVLLDQREQTRDRRADGYAHIATLLETGVASDRLLDDIDGHLLRLGLALVQVPRPTGLPGEGDGQ